MADLVYQGWCIQPHQLIYLNPLAESASLFFNLVFVPGPHGCLSQLSISHFNLNDGILLGGVVHSSLPGAASTSLSR
jgi:hypothetical protein